MKGELALATTVDVTYIKRVHLVALQTEQKKLCALVLSFVALV